MDRYIVINDFEHADTDSQPTIKPRIGIYDKWDLRNMIDSDVVPADGGGNTPKPDDKPDGGKIPNPNDKPDQGGDGVPDTESGGGAGWAIFFIILIIGAVGVIAKFKGKEILEKVKELRSGGGGTGAFETAAYDGDGLMDLSN